MKRLASRSILPLPALRLAAPTATSPRVEVIESEADLTSVEPLWNELAHDCESPSASHSWHWLVTWWEQFGRRCPFTGVAGKLHLVIVYSQSLPIAIFPFFSRNGGGLSLKPRTLQLLGHCGAFESCSVAEEPMTLIRRGYSLQSTDAVVRHLESGLKDGRWDCYVFDLLLDRGYSLRETVRNAIGTKPIRFKTKIGSRIVMLPETWGAFRQMLGKSMRDNMAYYPRRLVRHGHEWTVKIVRDPREVGEGIVKVIELHRLRATTTSRSKHENYFSTQNQAKFYVEIHRLLALEGKAFVALLEIEGETVAAQAFIESGDELLVGYSGFDPKWARYSPLFVLEVDVFKKALESGVRRLNLLKGKAQWQGRWKPESPCNLTTFVSCSLKPVSLLRVAVYVLIREIALTFRRGALANLLNRSKTSRGNKSRSKHGTEPQVLVDLPDVEGVR